MRKIISVLLTGALTLSLVSFTGCGKDSASKAKDITFDDNGDIVASSGTVINVWTYCDGDEEARTNELCAAFNEKYKEYNITAKFTPYASSSWETKMKATLSSSTGPDVFIASDQYYKQWATLGYMENLDPYIESDNESMNMEAEIADMFQGNVGRYLYDVDTTTDDGPNAHYYGLPKGTGATAIYYNKTYMENAGINIISVYEEEMDSYNAQNGTSFPKKAYFQSEDGKWYFNNRIPMNWEECADLATKLQAVNKAKGCEYGFLTSWWFNYGFSVGGSCIQHLESDDPAYNDGYYTFTLADSTVNYKANEDIMVNGNSYAAGTVVSYEDKFYLDDAVAAKCDVLPSQRRAFSEYMSLAGQKDSDHYYTGQKGVTDIFWELVPYKLAGGGQAGIEKNDSIMKENVNGYLPAAGEAYGSEQVTIYNKGISPNPSTFSTDGRISYFYNGKVAMCVEARASVQDCRDAMTDEWDVAPMLVYREYDENNQAVVSGIEGAHSGSTAWCIWNKSQVKNAAYLFVKFAAGEEGQRILCQAGTIIANQESVAEEMVKADVDAGKSPANLEIFSKGAEYQTPGDWWFLKDGDWIDAEGCWANYLNQTVRNFKATIPAFYTTNDYLGTFEKLLKYTMK